MATRRARCNGCLQEVAYSLGPDGATTTPCACSSSPAPAVRATGRAAARAQQRPSQRVAAAAGPWHFAPAATVTRDRLVLWLPRAPRADEGPNGRSWRRRARAAQEWRALVATALEQLGDGAPRWQRAAVAYTAYTRGRAMDRDNLVAVCKPVLDGLVQAGVLPDDSPAHLPDRPAAASERSPLPWGWLHVDVRNAFTRRGGPR